MSRFESWRAHKVILSHTPYERQKRTKYGLLLPSGQFLSSSPGSPCGRTWGMARTTVTYTISLPPEMAVELEEIRKKEHRTRSELLREALRRYSALFHNNKASPQGD
ncbi:MAG: ribbon-helix-helix domain-containing protein [bacterium]|nr:ribbon-helix-helix domain-containing protein [bacterium]